MQIKNTKVKSIFIFVGMLIIIAGISFLAYKACLNAGKSQQKAQIQTAKENTKAAEATTDAGTKVAETDQSKAEDIANAQKKSEKKSIRLGLDLQGGVTIVYQPKLDRAPTEDEMAAARTMIQRRLDAKGYTEAEVALEGKTKIRVDIPGVEDPQKAIEEIGAAGMLRFLDEQGKEIVTGKNVKKAEAQGVQSNGKSEIVVGIEMDSEGTKLFSDFTKNNIGKPIFIMLDELQLSAATIQSHIPDGKGQISGGFTAERAKELAEGINAGALPFTLEAVNAESIGPKLGMQSLNTSMLAGSIGLIIILLAMVIIFRLSGFAADIALVLYTGINILVLNAMGATLTLPGIAGTLLSIGMAVDANIIIFARIREELMLGKSVPSAVEAGFHKAFSAILDGNVTTLISAAVLYMFGTGLVKSFATTLGIGVIVNMFTALAITHILIKSFIGMGIKNPKLYATYKSAE